MLGITYHNPATISVFLDRMRFRDCFISTDELRKGDWQRKLKSFVDLPSDGRERVVFVESFATLQVLLQNGATLDTVKVAVYDDCSVLAKVPGASIVDAHINGSSTDTWQLYTVSFDEFNDALAQQPNGVPALIRDHDVKEDADIPEPPRPSQRVEVQDDEDEEEPDEPDDKKDRSVLVMKQLLDDIERDDEDGEDGDEDMDAPVIPREPDGSRVVLRKRQPEPEPEPEEPDDWEAKQPAEPEPPPEPELEEPEPEEPEPEPPPEPVVKEAKPPPSRPEPKPKKQKRKRAKPEPPKSYELF
jgi:hypothetical protein